MNEHSDPMREVLSWFKQNTMEIGGFDLAEPLGNTVEAFLRKRPHAASVIGLGEMTHGASEIVQGRFCLLKHLVQEHGVTLIILESEMSRTKMLNDCVLSGEGNLDEALSATGSFLAAAITSLGQRACSCISVKRLRNRATRPPMFPSHPIDNTMLSCSLRILHRRQSSIVTTAIGSSPKARCSASSAHFLG